MLQHYAKMWHNACAAFSIFMVVSPSIFYLTGNVYLAQGILDILTMPTLTYGYALYTGHCRLLYETVLATKSEGYFGRQLFCGNTTANLYMWEPGDAVIPECQATIRDMAKAMQDKTYNSALFIRTVDCSARITFSLSDMLSSALTFPVLVPSAMLRNTSVAETRKIFTQAMCVHMDGLRETLLTLNASKFMEGLVYTEPVDNIVQETRPTEWVMNTYTHMEQNVTRKTSYEF